MLRTKLEPREIKQLVHGHTAGFWQSAHHQSLCCSFRDIKSNEVTQEEGRQVTNANVGMEVVPVRAEGWDVLKLCEN